MTVEISSELLTRIVADAAPAPVEICGLLFGALDAKTGDRIEYAQPCRNVAADPRHRFEIDPAALIAAHRAARAGGPAILGCYHSHPTGGPVPSPRDAADAAPNRWLWLIVGAGEARLFRAVEDGAIQGRFEPVPLSRAPARAGARSRGGDRP